MNYVKKMCILRQVKQGFSGDGKALSGLIKIEQYGKNLAVEVSIINFAPLALGEYYCLLADEHGKTEMLSLRGKSLFNILSDLDISSGFCGVICYVKNEIVPIAYGINGNGSYDWRALLNATLPPSFSKKSREKAALAVAKEQEETGEFFTGELKNEPIKTSEPLAAQPLNQEQGNAHSAPPLTAEPREIPLAPTSKTKTSTEGSYDDESVATENYYLEDDCGQELFQKAGNHAQAESGTEKQGTKTGADASENGDAGSVLHAFQTQSQGYFLSVKSEMDELLKKYPRDHTLSCAFSCSEWVRVKGEKSNPQYLVGVVYDDGKAKYICYALAAEDKDNPPPEIESVCTFVPATPYEESRGFFVIFQSAATGECVKPQRI